MHKTSLFPMSVTHRVQTDIQFGGGGGLTSVRLVPYECTSPTVRETIWGQSLINYLDEYASPWGSPETRGASQVAIDNKIEQAMDLVKSHLMYAVREEVEVLKEQIQELREKNSQLEYENSILKSAASPETLAKLANKPAPAPHSQQPATSSS